MSTKQMTKPAQTGMTSYHEVTAEAVDELEADLEQDERDREARKLFLKVEEGDTVVRGLPPWKPGITPIKKLYIHPVRNPDQPDQPPRKVPCATKNKTGHECGGCKHVAALRATGNKDDKEAAFDLSSYARYFMAVGVVSRTPKGSKKSDPGEKGLPPKIWEFGPKVLKQLLGIFKQAPHMVSPGPDGFNLVVHRKGSGKTDTEYTVTPELKGSAIYDHGWLAAIPDLDAFMTDPTPEQWEAILRGEDPNAAPVPEGGPGAPDGMDAAPADDLGAQDLSDDPL